MRRSSIVAMNYTERRLNILLIFVLLSFWGSVQPAFAIVGGQVAEAQQWDFVVMLRIGSRSVCTGTVIQPTVVLTAAHCVVTSDGSPLGAIQAKTRRGMVPLETLYVDPRYGKGEDWRDVALLRSPQPFDVVIPGSVMSSTRYAEMIGGKLPGEMVAIVGFGKDDKGQVGQRKIIFPQGYSIGMGEFTGYILQKDQTQAGATRGGDSGSGILFNDDGKIVVGGVTSSGAALEEQKRGIILRKVDPVREDFNITLYASVVPSLCESPVDVQRESGFDHVDCAVVMRFDHILRNNESPLAAVEHLLVHRVAQSKIYGEFGYGSFWYYHSFFSSVKGGFRPLPEEYKSMVNSFRGNEYYIPSEGTAEVKALIREINNTMLPYNDGISAVSRGRAERSGIDVKIPVSYEVSSAYSAVKDSPLCRFDDCIEYFYHRYNLLKSKYLNKFGESNWSAFLSQTGKDSERTSFDLDTTSKIACQIIRQKPDWEALKKILRNQGIPIERISEKFGVKQSGGFILDTLSVAKGGSSDFEITIQGVSNSDFYFNIFPVSISTSELDDLERQLESEGFYKSSSDGHVRWQSGASVRLSSGRSISVELEGHSPAAKIFSISSTSASPTGKVDHVSARIFKCK